MKEQPFVPQSCDCPESNHTGPHWLYLDYFDWRQNLRLLEDAVHAAQRGRAMDVEFRIFAYAQAEAMRLKEKARCMEHDHISHIKYEVLGLAYHDEDLQAKERELYEQLRQAIEENKPSVPAINMSRPCPKQAALWESEVSA